MWRRRSRAALTAVGRGERAAAARLAGRRAGLGASQPGSSSPRFRSPPACGSCRAGARRRTRPRSICVSIPAWPSAPAVIPPPGSACAGWRPICRRAHRCSTMAAAAACWRSLRNGWAPVRWWAWTSTRAQLQASRDNAKANAVEIQVVGARRCAAGALRRGGRQHPVQPAEAARPAAGRLHPARRAGGAGRHPGPAGGSRGCRLRCSGTTCRSPRRRTAGLAWPACESYSLSCALHVRCTMSMFTRCPHCDTVFRVTPQQLQVSSGQVRCGRCQEVFDAFSTLTSRLPGGRLEDAAIAAARPEAADPPGACTSLPCRAMNPASWGLDGARAGAAGPGAGGRQRCCPASAGAGVPEPEILTLPPELFGVAAGPPGRRWPWVVGLSARLLALAAQAAWFFPGEIALRLPNFAPAARAILRVDRLQGSRCRGCPTCCSSRPPTCSCSIQLTPTRCC